MVSAAGVVAGGSASAPSLLTSVVTGKTAANSHVGNWPSLPMLLVLPDEEGASATLLAAVVLSVGGSGLVVVVGGSHCAGVFFVYYPCYVSHVLYALKL